MAIQRPVRNPDGTPVLKPDGTPATLPVPDFAYTDNACLAQLIVYAWGDDDYQNLLLEREGDGITVTPAAARAATAAVRECGFYLERAVVISEDEYWRPYTLQDPDEVVFVLPNPTRVKTTRPGQPLLETARLLMATVPNGI